MHGPARIQAELKALGFESDVVAIGDEKFIVVSAFEVPLGRFSGRVIELGLPAPPNFPISVGSAIHVRAEPQLLEKEHIPNVRNVTDSVLGAQWRYWSIDFRWSGECERSVARLMAKINRVFADA